MKIQKQILKTINGYTRLDLMSYTALQGIFIEYASLSSYLVFIVFLR